MKNNILKLFALTVLSVFVWGCATTGNVGNLPSYPVSTVEAEWIRNGEPLEFEGETWYPKDTIDVLTDSEVMPMGKYKEVQFYTEKIDVRPFSRLYTKFGPNQFRIFKKKIKL